MSIPRIRTAVVTGRHPYDVYNFQAVFKSIPEIDFYPQHLEDFVTDTGGTRYDVIVFYNFHQETPGNEKNWWERGMKESLERLGGSEQGILLLHHAILAFPKWDFWTEIVGIKDRTLSRFDMDQQVRTHVKTKHPITEGLSDWDMVDETYLMNSPSSEDCEILLTTDNPNSMKVLGWARTFKKSRVFCYQSGHDNQAYSNPSFRKVIANAILWLAGRL